MYNFSLGEYLIKVNNQNTSVTSWASVDFKQAFDDLVGFKAIIGQVTFTCSMSTIKTLEKGVKYVQS